MTKYNLKGIPAEKCILGTNYSKKKKKRERERKKRRKKKEKQNGQKVHNIYDIFKEIFF